MKHPISVSIKPAAAQLSEHTINEVARKLGLSTTRTSFLIKEDCGPYLGQLSCFGQKQEKMPVAQVYQLAGVTIGMLDAICWTKRMNDKAPPALASAIFRYSFI